MQKRVFLKSPVREKRTGFYGALLRNGSPTAIPHPLREGEKAMSPDQLEEGSWEFHRLTPER